VWPHSVDTATIKSLDAQVLFDPLEEQFNVPTVFINLRYRHAIGLHVVAQKHKSLAGFTVNELDATNEFRIILDRIRTCESNFSIYTGLSDYFIVEKRQITEYADAKVIFFCFA